MTLLSLLVYSGSITVEPSKFHRERTANGTPSWRFQPVSPRHRFAAAALTTTTLTAAALPTTTLSAAAVAPSAVAPSAIAAAAVASTTVAAALAAAALAAAARLRLSS